MRRLRHIIRKCRIRMGLCTVRAMYDYRKSRERGREVRGIHYFKKTHTQKKQIKQSNSENNTGDKREGGSSTDRQTDKGHVVCEDGQTVVEGALT